MKCSPGILRRLCNALLKLSQPHQGHLKHLTLKLGSPVSGLPNLANACEPMKAFASGGKVVLFYKCFHLLDALPLYLLMALKIHVVHSLCPTYHSCCFIKCAGSSPKHVLFYLPSALLSGHPGRSMQCSSPGVLSLGHTDVQAWIMLC